MPSAPPHPQGKLEHGSSSGISAGLSAACKETYHVLLEQHDLIVCIVLNSTSTGTTEFDFERDRYDIRLPPEAYETMNDPSKSQEGASYIPESFYSLRVRSRNVEGGGVVKLNL